MKKPGLTAADEACVLHCNAASKAAVTALQERGALDTACVVVFRSGDRKVWLSASGATDNEAIAMLETAVLALRKGRGR